MHDSTSLKLRRASFAFGVQQTTKHFESFRAAPSPFAALIPSNQGSHPSPPFIPTVSGSESHGRAIRSSPSEGWRQVPRSNATTSEEQREEARNFQSLERSHFSSRQSWRRVPRSGATATTSEEHSKEARDFQSLERRHFCSRQKWRRERDSNPRYRCR